MKQKLMAWGCLFVTTAVLAALDPIDASAQFLGQVSTARTVESGANDVGGFLGLYDHAMAVFGQYRRGFARTADFGAFAGLFDPEGGSARLTLGGDVKFQVLDDQRTDPFDLSLDSRLALIDYPGSLYFSIGESVVCSHNFRIASGSALAPYGAVNVRLDHVYSNSNLEIAAAGGVKWEFSDLIDAYGELVFDEDLGLVLGLNFKI
jgi:hypothetical protein